MQRNADSSVDEVLIKKVQAFKTIYRAIFEVEENLSRCKHDFLIGKEHLSLKDYVTSIEEHIKQMKSKKEKKDNKAIQVAWTLANKYYDSCREDNLDLFNEIHQSLIHHAWYPGIQLFSKLGKKKNLLTLAQIKEKLASDKIIFSIYYQLAFPIPLGEIWPEARGVNFLNRPVSL